jgi:hypothetical protein
MTTQYKEPRTMTNHKPSRQIAVIAILFVAALTVSCAGGIASDRGRECSEGLRIAFEELDFAKAKGFSGTVAWSKAASLLSAAEVNKQLEKFPGCIDKVTRARAYIRESQQ